MKISIITITYNNADGLRKTIESVLAQTYTDFEYIIVDGGSIDNSLDIIKSLIANGAPSDRSERQHRLEWQTAHPLKWVSEKDAGVYDAQNKGIVMASGDYCFFLNAGDCFCNNTVLERIFAAPLTADIIYGNERVVKDDVLVGYCKGVENPTFLDLYNSCMKHQATFIRHELFDCFGLYNDEMKMSADWDWFFRVIGYHDKVSLQYVDVDIANFDNNGLSNRSPKIYLKEHQMVLDNNMSKRMQIDYKLLNKFINIRYIEKSKFLSLILRAIGKLAKYLYK